MSPRIREGSWRSIPLADIVVYFALWTAGFFADESAMILDFGTWSSSFKIRAINGIIHIHWEVSPA